MTGFAGIFYQINKYLCNVLGTLHKENSRIWHSFTEIAISLLFRPFNLRTRESEYYAEHIFAIVILPV